MKGYVRDDPTSLPDGAREPTGHAHHETARVRELQATVDAGRDAVLAWDPDGRVLAVNRRFRELWGLDEAAVPVGADAARVLTQHLVPQLEPGPLRAALRWAREHPGEPQALDLPLRDGRVVQGYAVPLTDQDGQLLGRAWYVHDDTDRRTTEAQRAALLARLAQAEQAQRFLLEASAVLARTSGFTETLEALATVAVPTLGDLCLIDVVDETWRPRRVAAVHADPSRRALVEQLRTRYAPDPDGQHPSMAAMRSRTSQWSPEMPDAFLRATTRDEEHYRITKELGFTSYMTVPLVGADEVLGALTLVSSGSGRRFGPADVRLAEELAGRVAQVVAKERRYDVERRISHTLQTSILHTELPVVPGVDFAVRYLPGTADAEVGGDFWDVTLMPSGELAIALGDVAGHDIRAAATMAQLRSACRALRSQTEGPDDLVRLLHSSWDQLGLDRMATAVFARLVAETGRLRIASAGHLPPLIVEADRAWFPTLDPAAPLGAPATETPPPWVGTLEPGATVLFYTDGLVEDRHRDIDEGTGRLIRAAMAAPCREAEPLVDHLLRTLSGPERADDVAVLAVHLRGGP